ncbi:MAG TPA: hypothetical protein DDY32_18095 [Desulfobulbaceae bacterium]|nr:hypothetical protein [Desulfobulbaceae bacterium]
MKRMRYPCFESPPKIIFTAETIQLQQKQDHRFTDILDDAVFRRKKQKSLKLMDFGFRRIENVFSSC